MSEYEVGLEVAKNRRGREGRRERLRAKVCLPEFKLQLAFRPALHSEPAVTLKSQISLFLSVVNLYPCHYRKFVMAYSIIEIYRSVIIKSMNRHK